MASSADNVVGMMDAAYFTSRKDILDWLNTTLELKLTKIEQTASGAVACQIIEYICPGSIPLKKVNWEAKTDHEYVQNYKLLQNAFNKNNIQRHIEVDKLVRAKYQDNLEFCQWLKAFFDQAAPPYREGYNPVAARGKGRGGKTASQRFQNTASQHTSKLLPVDRPGDIAGAKKKAPPHSSTARNPVHGRTVAASTKPASPSARTRATPHQKENLHGSSRNVKASSQQVAAAEHKQLQSDNVAMKQTNESLQTRNAELELTLVEMERERDFYFEKLSDIEMMMQHHKGSGNTDTNDLNKLLDRVYSVLVNSDDSKGGESNENDEQDDITGASVLDMSVDQPLNDSALEEDDEDDDDHENLHDDSLLDDLLSDEAEAEGITA